MMQTAEDAQSTLADRVETLGVSEQSKTTEYEKENEKETGEKTTETTDETKTNEDATGKLHTCVQSRSTAILPLSNCY